MNLITNFSLTNVNKAIFSVLILIITFTSLFGQSPDTLWTRTFGGTNWDEGKSVQVLASKDIIISGFSHSFGDWWQFYLIKTDSSGNLIWQKTYGGAYDDCCYSQEQTSDSGFIMTGWTSSFGSGLRDVYLVKTNAYGDTLWTRTYGGTERDIAFSVKEARDKGYIIAGQTNSFGAGNSDIFIVKTDSSGTLEWMKTYGGASNDYGYSVQETTDSAFIVCGFTESFSAGKGDIYIIKTNINGDSVWTKAFGDTADERAYSVQQTSDGGFIITGYTESYGAGNSDIVLIKTNEAGNITWQRSYGGTNYDCGYSVCQTQDSGYIVAGDTKSFGSGESDVYIIRTDANGDTLWTATFGGAGTDKAYAVTQTQDADYVVTGATASYGAGSYDVYLLKVKFHTGLCETNYAENLRSFSNLNISPNPFHNTAVLHFKHYPITFPTPQVKIYDQSGRLLINKAVASNPIVLGSNLKPGIYFLTINNFKNKKLVKFR